MNPGLDSLAEPAPAQGLFARYGGALVGLALLAGQLRAEAPDRPSSPVLESVDEQEQGQGQESNDYGPCPVTPEEASEAEFFTDYEGRTLHFCCRKCQRKFLVDPASYASATMTQRAGAAPEVEQDHADHHHAGESRLARTIGWMGRFHPMIVHFPIGLILAAAFAEVLVMARRWKELAAPAARFCLRLGAVSAVLAAALGWANAASQSAPVDGTMALVLLYHRWLGTAAALGALSAWFLAERSRLRPIGPGRAGYRITLFTTALAVIVAGHLGGSMIFGWDYLNFSALPGFVWVAA